ncbi:MULTISPECIES: hypothetical protein [unclassified Streptomyces]|uniref:hypothetical protein n=1 Tax=unclassified Streptomyces TaxID=2593676 RepID=UPI002E2A695C|nr:hypothetical protein [Streptomyces sp. NBC_00273]
MAYEQKLDGHRALVFTAASPGGTVPVETRCEALFREVQCPPGLVLDGELVVRDTEAGGLSFEALQCTPAARACGAAGPGAWWPAYLSASVQAARRPKRAQAPAPGTFSGAVPRGS